VLDPEGVRIAFTGQDRFVHTASSGQSFLVTWNDMTTPSGVMGTVISEDGTRSDSVRLNAADSVGADFNVGFDGAQYAAVWLDYTEYPNTIWAANVSLDGEASAPVEIPSHDARANDPPNLLWVDDHYLLSYVGKGVVGETLSSDLTSQGGDIALSAVEARQDSPQSCFDGTHYVLAWTEYRGTLPSQTARTEQIGQDGNVLDAETLQLGTAGAEYSRDVALACAGQNSSVSLWRDADSETISARQRLSDGSFGVEHLVASGARTQANLASNGESYLLAFLADGPDDQTVMRAQFLELDGAPRSESFDLRQTGVFVGGSLSAIGDGYLWYYDDNENTYLQPISATGELAEPIVLDTGRTSVSSANASDRGLIVYNKLGPDGETRVPVLQFVAQGDWNSAIIPLGLEASYAIPAWDGTQFVLVAQDEAYGAALYTVADNGELSLQQQLLTEESYIYGVASNGAGQLLLTYTRYLGELQRSTRIFNLLIGDPLEVDLSGRVNPPPVDEPPSAAPTGDEPPAAEPPVQPTELPVDEPPASTDDDSTAGPDDSTAAPTAPSVPPSAGSSLAPPPAPEPTGDMPATEATESPAEPIHGNLADAAAGPSNEEPDNADDAGCSVTPQRTQRAKSSGSWDVTDLVAFACLLRRRRARMSQRRCL
jgi:hypothetical protein